MANKIFIGLSETAGYYANLKTGFQDIGVECVFVNLSDHPFKYGGDDEPNSLIKMYKRILKTKNGCGSRWIRIPLFGLLLIMRVPIFIWAVSKYNVFIIVSGQSFFGHYDLAILKLLKKKIIVTFTGSDIRPPYIDGYLNCLNGKSINRLHNISIKSNKTVLSVEHYADVIITHPAYAHFLESEYIKFLAIGLPFSTMDEVYPQNISIKNSVRILHSPSDPIGKGSGRIRAAIANLQGKGYEIEYIEITGKPHKTVIEELQTCDFVVDQVYSDTPMATFATEAAWFGKPSVVGGYYSEFIEDDYSKDDIPPTMFCHPDDIQVRIEKLIVDVLYREELGKRAKEYVRSRCTPQQVAMRYLQVIEGDIPKEWIANPYNIHYLQGYGMEESQSKEIVHSIIEHYGIGALCLSGKPELEEKFRVYSNPSQIQNNSM